MEIPHSDGLPDESIVHAWWYKHYFCVVRKGIEGCPCGYVEIPSTSLFKKRGKKFCYENLYPHGGITFYGSLEEFGPNKTFVGFDMAHSGDIVIRNNRILPVIEPRYTCDECKEEVEYLVNQMLCIEYEYMKEI